MHCPYCHHDFPLTWSRYWGAPFGKHRCPKCRQDSKLAMTVGYLLALLAAWVVVFVVSAGLAAVSGAIAWKSLGPSDKLNDAVPILILLWLGGTWLAGMILTTLFDRYFDEHYRVLQKLPNQDDVESSDIFIEKP